MFLQNYLTDRKLGCSNTLYLPRCVTLEKVEHAERQFDAFIAGSLEEVATVSVGGVGQGVIRATEVTRFPHAAAREVMVTFCGKNQLIFCICMIVYFYFIV